MDLDIIKAKLAASNAPKGKKYEKVDYTKIFWSPKKGKSIIRVVPSLLDKSNPFLEVMFHYGFTKFPLLSLQNWGEKDPIADFAKGLFKSSDKEDWELGKKIQPKQRIFIPVIVRGEEEKGVRLWQFGKGVYQQLLGIAADEDYGDFTDVAEGRDFTVEGVEEQAFGKTVITPKVLVKPKQTPLSTDPEEIKLWLENQPNVLTLNKKHTFEEMKAFLVNYLTPSAEDETVEIETVDTESNTDDDEDKDVPTTPKPKAKGKASNADKFNDLFDK